MLKIVDFVFGLDLLRLKDAMMKAVKQLKKLLVQLLIFEMLAL